MTAHRQPPKVPRPTPVPRVPSPLVQLEPAAAADLLAGAALPLIEPTEDGEYLVTFCWQDPAGQGEGAAEQVLLFANRLTDETSLADTLLEHLQGTDWWHATFRMAGDWRASYAFMVHRVGEPATWQSEDQVRIRQVLDQGLRDPHNPTWCSNRAGVAQSVVELPGAPAQPWTQPRAEVARGIVSAHELPESGVGSRQVWCYQPPGVAPEVELPLLVALDGEVWLEASHSLPVMLDNLIADGELPPVRALLPASGGRERRWQDLGAEGSGVAELTEILLPWVRERFAVAPDRVAVAGQSLGGLTALRAGLLHGEVFSGVISHSASLWQDDLIDLLDAAAASDRPLPRIHLAHGAQEWVLTDPHQRFAEHARAVGIDLDASIHNGGHDYAWWRGGLAEGLRWLWGGTAEA